MDKTICQNCGKWAIKQGTGIALMSNPPIYPQEYKCKCGWTQKAESIRGKTQEDIFDEKWKEANNE